MTQIEPQITSPRNQSSQVIKDGIFSQEIHDLVMEHIHPPSQKTTLAAAMELVVEGFAKIGIQIGNRPSTALQIIDYRNAQIRGALHTKDAVNDAEFHQPKPQKSA